jgi:hypothetical protein
MTRGLYQEDVERQEQLVRLADRTARAVEMIRSVVVGWSILAVLAVAIGLICLVLNQ